MKFSYNWLKELAGFKDSPQALAEFLTLRAFEVESVTDKHKKEHADDWALDIKLIPNRTADASGHAGMAREITALKKLKVKSEKLKMIESAKRADEFLKVKIENPEDCPRYTARVMNGVTVGPSPAWLRERLEVCGLQSINNVVDAANCVMLELGQPLHVFDFDKLGTRGSRKREIINPKLKFPNKSQIPNPKTIIVRRARSGERLLALDDKTYPLSTEILVIADEKDPIGIAGIKGGHYSGVAAKTKTIILESANFDPVRIRIGSKLLNLKTDASYRFERGMDPNETAAAVDRLAGLIREIAGGEILLGRVDAYPKPLRPGRILLRSEYLNRLVGEVIAAQFVEQCFKRLGWAYARRGRDYVITPPTIRRDIQIEEDVIEEIVRLWGYERVRLKPPLAHIPEMHRSEERDWEEQTKDALVSSGYTEAFVYAFTGEKALDAFGASTEGLLEIENPTTPEFRYLEAHPAHGFLRATAENLRHMNDVSLFGVMEGFKPAKRPSPKEPAEEKKYLVVVKAAKVAKAAKDSGESFFAVKGALDRLFEALGIAEHWYDDALTDAERQKLKAVTHPYRTAKVVAGGETLGIVAELHPSVQERLKAKARLVFAELDFARLSRLARSEAEYRPVGKYPAVIRDIAVIVPEDTKADDVEEVIQNAGGALLIDVDLFDYFQDEQMEVRGGKSLAFHLIFQSPERTLTDEEVNRPYQKIAAALKTRSWEIRE